MTQLAGRYYTVDKREEDTVSGTALEEREEDTDTGRLSRTVERTQAGGGNRGK
jgi:hypothetical protein